MRAWRAAGIAGVLWLLGPATLASAEPSATSPIVADEEEDEGGLYTLLNEQMILVATIVGAIAALPALIEFLVERRKRKERIALSLEDEPVAELKPRLAGFEKVFEEIADLIDRARDPASYASLHLGNEILVLGRPLSGKKTFAQRLAKEARMDRLITVWNPRNADALARAKTLVRSSRRQKIVLLLPRLDTVHEQADDELLSELDALIETTAGRANVLVIATATRFQPDDSLDNTFGIKLVLPGTPRAPLPRHEPKGEERQVLVDVARFYLQEAYKAGFSLCDMDEADAVARLVETAGNPAGVEDIVVLCRGMAMYRRRANLADGLYITPEILETSIGRVIVKLADEAE